MDAAAFGRSQKRANVLGTMQQIEQEQEGLFTSTPG
jgi:hypothetical protein